jgi:hypothetical protein
VTAVAAAAALALAEGRSTSERLVTELVTIWHRANCRADRIGVQLFGFAALHRSIHDVTRTTVQWGISTTAGIVISSPRSRQSGGISAES